MYRSIGIILVILLAIAGIAYAGAIDTPHTFTTGTVINADEMNANFTEIDTEVDDNDSRITTNAGAIGTNATDIGTNSTNIGINAGNIGTNATDIGTNSTNIGTNATNISNNDSDIATLQGNVAPIPTMQTDISDNADDITTLFATTTTLEQPLVLRASDRDSNGNLTGADIEATMALCTGDVAERYGCIIELLVEDYDEVHLTVPLLVKEIRPVRSVTSEYSAAWNALDGAGPKRPRLIGSTRPVDHDVDGADATGASVNYHMLNIPPNVGGRPRVHGLWIHGFHIDGNKQNWESGGIPSMNSWWNAEGTESVSPYADSHDCIHADAQGVEPASGLLIENMLIESCGQGITVSSFTNIVIRDNIVEKMGCWELESISEGTGFSEWEPNGIPASEIGCGAWGTAQTSYTDWSLTQPGIVFDGVGIEITDRTRNAVVTRNEIRYFTKMGLQTWTGDSITGTLYNGGEVDADPLFLDPAFDSWSDPFPKSVVFSENHIHHGETTAISLVKGISVDIINNHVHNIDAPWHYGNVGKGISCLQGGRFSSFVGNVITSTGGYGMDVGCACGTFVNGTDSTAPDNDYTCDVVVANNIITDPCQGTLISTDPADDVAGGGQYWTGADADDLTTGIYVAINTANSRYDPTSPPPPTGYSATPAERITFADNRVIRGEQCLSGWNGNGGYNDISITGLIASGQVTLGTDTIAAYTCDTTPTTITADEVASTDVVDVSFSGDPTGVSGYGPGATDGLAIYAYPSTDQITLKVCNLTNAEISGRGALTVNWRVER